jgi:hypothetical protein
MHGDHTKGLGSRWSRGPLYCSPITSRLLCVRFPGFDKRLLRPLEVGASTMVEVWNRQKLELMEVIPIDAHHCPGETATIAYVAGRHASVVPTAGEVDKGQCMNTQVISWSYPLTQTAASWMACHLHPCG